MADLEKKEPRTRGEQAAYIVERVKALGFDVRPTSRLGTMLHTLQKEHIEPNDSAYAVAIESIRDMYQLHLIVDTMDGHRENRAFRLSVHRMLKDAAVPCAGDRETQGRDRQFPLYVAAVCINGGLKVEHEEPDVTCVIDGTRCGIAAKRLKSMHSLDSQIRKGANQIRDASLLGIIAIDLTLARNTKNRAITSPIESELYLHIAHAKNRHLAEKYGDGIKRRVAGKGVLAVLVFEFTLRLMAERTWSHDGMMFWFETTDGDKQAARKLNTFQKAILAGVPNLEDLTKEE